MSSADRSTSTERQTTVAPREIVDVVTRILRIHGFDPATATDLATDVMCCAAEGQPAIDLVLACVDDGTVSTLSAPHAPREPQRTAVEAGHRAGIRMPLNQLRALERAASGFLVAESLLDSLADEPTVD